MSFPTCPSCQRETNPFSELNPDHGMIQKCGHVDCGAWMPKAAPVTRAAAAPAPALEVAHDRVRSPFEAIRSMTPPQPPMAGAPSPIPDPPRAPGGLRADDLMDFARARLAVVEAQLAEKGALELEAAKLRRILAADDPTPTKALN